MKNAVVAACLVLVLIANGCREDDRSDPLVELEEARSRADRESFCEGLAGSKKSFGDAMSKLKSAESFARTQVDRLSNHPGRNLESIQGIMREWNDNAGSLSSAAEECCIMAVELDARAQIGALPESEWSDLGRSCLEVGKQAINEYDELIKKYRAQSE